MSDEINARLNAVFAKVDQAEAEKRAAEERSAAAQATREAARQATDELWNSVGKGLLKSAVAKVNARLAVYQKEIFLQSRELERSIRSVMSDQIVQLSYSFNRLNSNTMNQTLFTVYGSGKVSWSVSSASISPVKQGEFTLSEATEASFVDPLLTYVEEMLTPPNRRG